MEENEVKVESENVAETPEIPDKTPLESKKMSPKEKKATWIIGSIGVLCEITAILIFDEDIRDDSAFVETEAGEEFRNIFLPWLFDIDKTDVHAIGRILKGI